MLQRIPSVWQTETWQQQLAGAVRDVGELLALLDLPATALPELRPATAAFPLRVPRSFVARMKKGDPADPLLQQVLPAAAELLDFEGYVSDPVGDMPATAGSGVVHKYAGRALIIATGACAVHCRYCFRRHYPYQQNSAGADRWRTVIDYLGHHPEVDEVILSGGDPLALGDESLAAFVNLLSRLPHLRRLRIHTRLPIVMPARVSDPLLAWLGKSRLPVIVVLHANHPNEIDDEVGAAALRLKHAGATLLNQSVLLRGINDDAAVLATLSERLFAIGVLPYYLHLLDRVHGAAHFDVEESRARLLHLSLQQALPGYLVPRLVRELPGALAKRLIA